MKKFGFGNDVSKPTPKEGQNLAKQQIDGLYASEVQTRLVQTNIVNIVLVGRTRGGKSSFKEMLKDPRQPPKPMTLYSETRDSTMSSFCVSINDQMFTLNIIDTPGLFEKVPHDGTVRTAQQILKTVSTLVCTEVTKIHVLLVVIQLHNGINDEDLKAVKLYRDFFGDKMSKNTALLVTHCEDVNEEQRKRLLDELFATKEFKEIEGFFKLHTQSDPIAESFFESQFRGSADRPSHYSALFSGTINPNTWEQGQSQSLLSQFVQVLEDRERFFAIISSPTLKSVDIPDIGIAGPLLGAIIKRNLLPEGEAPCTIL